MPACESFGLNFPVSPRRTPTRRLAEQPAVLAQSILDKEEEEDKKFVAEQTSLSIRRGN